MVLYRSSKCNEEATSTCKYNLMGSCYFLLKLQIRKMPPTDFPIFEFWGVTARASKSAGTVRQDLALARQVNGRHSICVSWPWIEVYPFYELHLDHVRRMPSLRLSWAHSESIQSIGDPGKKAASTPTRLPKIEWRKPSRTRKTLT